MHEYNLKTNTLWRKATHRAGNEQHNRKRSISWGSSNKKVQAISGWKTRYNNYRSQTINQLLKLMEPGSKLMRRAMLLRSYNFGIQYKPTKANRCVDAS